MKRYIEIKDIIEKTGLTKKIIYRMEEAGTFPKNVACGKATRIWLESEVDNWVKVFKELTGEQLDD